MCADLSRHADVDGVFILSGPIPVFMGNVTGNIYVPFDFRYVVQNFSSDSYNITIPPGVQTSFSFHFTPERYLQPRDFGLALAAFYIVGDSLHASLLINRTVEVLEPVGYVSGESVFLVLLAAGLLALLGVWAYGQVTKMNQAAKMNHVRLEGVMCGMLGYVKLAWGDWGVGGWKSRSDGWVCGQCVVVRACRHDEPSPM
ncbi:unnamed protein product [Closterium sp. NIES-65]|nr:unnamed protein product [Closterium sp. NIES-65]